MGHKRKYKRRKRPIAKEILMIALVAFLLGIVNFVLQRFTDGTLCTVAGIVALFVWNKKRKG